MPKRWLSAVEAMEYIGVGKSTFYKLVKMGKITSYKMDGLADYRFDAEELDKGFKPAKVTENEETDSDDE